MKVLQQGHADGLCGIYAVLNFLNRTEWKDTPSSGLWYLLESLRHFGWFTPQYIIDGFEDYHLKTILDYQFENYRMNYETHFVDEAARQTGASNFYELAQKVIAKKGSIIASWDKREHWVLISGQKGSVVQYDSASNEAVKPLSSRQKSLDTDYGVIILPKKKSASKIDL